MILGTNKIKIFREYKIVLWIIFMISNLSSCNEKLEKDVPVVKAGVIDLTDWDFDSDGPIQLKGQWRFAWGDFIEPGPIDLIRKKYTGFIKVPAVWDSQLTPGIPNEPLPGKGYGSYLLEIKFNPKNKESLEQLALTFYSGKSGRAQVWDVTGTNLLVQLEQGKPASSKDLEVPLGLAKVKSFRTNGHESLFIIAHISNFNELAGGFWDTPVLGLDDDVRGQIFEKLFRSLFLIGSVFIISLYHLVLFSQRREDKASLVFALFCAAVLFREVMVNRLVQILSSDFSLDSYNWMISLEYASIPLAIFSLGLYINLMVPGRLFNIIFKYWYLLISLVLFIFAIVVRQPLLSESLKYFQIHLLVGLIIVLIHLSVESIKGNRISRWILLSYLIIFMVTMNDSLHGMNIIVTGYYGPYSFLAFVLVQSGIISGNAAYAYRQAKYLSNNLQDEVRLQTIILEEKTNQLKELDKQKTSFFQNMSHELRTPLTLILNPLESAAIEHKKDKNIEIATKNSRRLLRLVNQLLDFQKLEAGKKLIKLIPIELNHFVSVCSDYFESACSHKKIRFSEMRNGNLLAKGNKPIWIRGEIDALEKIVFNYLSNALKYTPPNGTIKLGLDLQDHSVKLFVEDSGSGIAKEDHTKLFQVFSQVDGSATRTHEGTGLGLALVKSLTEEMNGKAGMESGLGKGSIFWVEFPLIEEEAIPEVDSLADDFSVKSWLLAESEGETGEDDLGDENSIVSSAKNELIMVVDDLADMRELIGNDLKAKNYRIITASNGKRGLDLARKTRPDLVVTDWMMPEMIGPELIKAMKLDPILNSVPVILLTAKSDEESKLIGTEIGADGFLGKPFNEKELSSIVKNLLSLKAREKEVESLNLQLTENVLKRYLPPVLVDQIVRGETTIEQDPKGVNGTVLFSDLVGFTELSEKVRAKTIARVLNEYLEVMNQIIFNNDGVIDKFVGDAIMVIWGAPSPMAAEEQVEKAAKCALEMQDAIEVLNDSFLKRDIPALKMRIGIHHGSIIVGNFGSKIRSDYTAIGPVVNLAARIEEVCEPGKVYVSAEVCDLLPEELTTNVGDFDLKGLSGRRNIYKLAG